MAEVNFSLFTLHFSLYFVSLQRHSIKLLIIMKKSIYLSLVFMGLLLTATGCGNKKQASGGTDDQAYRDSVAAAKAAEEAAFNKADSLAFNVWGDVKFGMSIEEVSKTGVFGTLKGSEEWYDVDGAAFLAAASSLACCFAAASSAFAFSSAASSS